MFLKLLQGSILSLLFLIVFVLLMLLPEFDIKGVILGGGPIRQWFANTFIFALLPDNFALSLIEYFNNTSIGGEWLLIAPVLFVFSLAFIPFSLFFIKLMEDKS